MLILASSFSSLNDIFMGLGLIGVLLSSLLEFSFDGVKFILSIDRFKEILHKLLMFSSLTLLSWPTWSLSLSLVSDSEAEIPIS